jgi:hypothetical protein
MDEFTLILNLPQMEATALILRAHSNHVNEVLGGIEHLFAQANPKPAEAEKPPESPAAPTLEVPPNG